VRQVDNEANKHAPKSPHFMLMVSFFVFYIPLAWPFSFISSYL